jgi:putative SOS response-associated peptidase YedK
VCNRYVAPDQAAIERHWNLRGGRPSQAWQPGIYPRSAGPFIRAAREGAERVVGQWGLVPHFATSARLSYQTNNARAEELARKASFRQPWARGQRCIIPALSFYEPCWETGRNVWWTFRRADGHPWGLAGLWNTWIDRQTGEVVESYTMLTLNADAHPLMRRMHKPDPRLGPDGQDKRSVIPIEMADVDRWLAGTIEDATGLLKLAPMEVFEARPLTPAMQPVQGSTQQA